MNQLLAVAAVLVATSLHVQAQESPADPSIGKWVGEWQVSGRPSISGSMEMELDVNGDQVTGQVKSRCTPADPREWAKLAGVRKGEKIFAQYDRGGRCGKVDIIYAIDREGKVMTGTFSNEYPASGTFRLTK